MERCQRKSANQMGGEEVRICLRSAKKLELVRRVQEREKEGWECIAPITKEKRYKKDFDRLNGQNKFRGVYDYEMYFVYMQKATT